MVLCGGVGNEDKAATEEVHNLAKQIQQSVHGKLNATFNVFEAIAYRTQVVAGTNYFIKVHVGGEKYVHLRVYKNLQQQVSLHSVQEDKTKEEPITYF